MLLAHDIEKKKRTADVYISENVDFTGMLLSEKVLEGLHAAGFKKPSPIQLKAVPLGLCGFDLIIQSKSGTGKTVVFSIIALQNFSSDLKNPQALILTPTREIAVQIQQVLSLLGSKIPGLSVKFFVGGLPEDDDKKVLLQSKVDIIIGTPGRIRSLIESKHLVTKSIKLFVVDEADKLMLESFKDDIDFIIKKLPSPRQMIATSATYSDSLQNTIESYMNAPIKINTDTDIPTLLGLKQFVSIVQSHLNVGRQMKIKTDELIRILSNIPFKQCIVFTNYQIRAESLSNNLNNTGWPSKYISASQTQKERLAVLKYFKNHECRVLISTDLTARGIDIQDVNLVINYDIPYDSATYLHRIGRAGRYGSQGLCITICCHGEEYEKFKRLILQISNKIHVAKLPSKDIMPENLWKCDESSFENIFENDVIPNEIQCSEIETKDIKEVQPVMETNDNLPATKENGIPEEESIKEDLESEQLSNHLDSMNKESNTVIYENTNSSSESLNEDSESAKDTDSDYGEPMIQDLSTTPEAIAKQKEKELILKRNIALMQVSKLMINLTPLPEFKTFDYFKTHVENRTEFEQSEIKQDSKIQNENADSEPFLSFSEMKEIVKNRNDDSQLRIESELVENEPESQSQSSAIQFLTDTKITDDVLAAVDFLLDLAKQQNEEFRKMKFKYHQIPYKKILNALLNRIPLEDLLKTNSNKRSPDTDSVRSPELIKSKVIFDSENSNTYTYEQLEDNRVRYSAKEQLYEMKDIKSKSKQNPLDENDIFKKCEETNKSKQQSRDRQKTSHENNIKSKYDTHDTNLYSHDNYYYQYNQNSNLYSCQNCSCHKCTCTCHYNYQNYNYNHQNYNYNSQNYNYNYQNRNHSFVVVPETGNVDLDPWYRMWIDQNRQIRNHIQQATYIRNMTQNDIRHNY